MTTIMFKFDEFQGIRVNLEVTKNTDADDKIIK